ncbi:MAG: hypothetical protein VX777_01600 [Chlamydiota bacterium]|nr:hypothetical protein [Chlamydiota bacterium]
MATSKIGFHNHYPKPPLQPQTMTNDVQGHNELTRLMIIEKNPKKALETMDQFKNPNTQDRNGVSLIHWTAFLAPRFPCECLGIMKKLLDSGEDINCPDSNASTPLHYLCNAITDNNIETIEFGVDWMNLMIQSGATPFLQTNRSLSPVDCLFENVRLTIESKVFLTKLLLNDMPSKEANALCQRGIRHFFTKNGIMNIPSLQDIQVILETYGDILDLENIDGKGNSILSYVAKNYSPETLENLCFIAALAINKGANPNGKNAKGNAILLDVIDQELLIYNKHHSLDSYNRLQLVVKALINLGADPLKSTHNIKKGFIRNTYHSLITLFSAEQAQNLYKTIYGCDVFTEIELRSLLLNSYSINNHISTLNEEIVELEGASSLETFITPHLYYLKQYYKELEEEIDSDKSLKLPLILERCYNLTLDTESLVKLKKVFKKIPNLLKECGTSQLMSPKNLANKIQENVPFSMLAGHVVKGKNGKNSAHAVSYYFIGNIMILGNCGGFSGKYPGVSIHRKPKNIRNFTQQIANRNDIAPFLKKYFPRNIDQHRLEDQVAIKYIPQKHQSIGNCPIKSFGSLELAVLYYELKNHFDDDTAINLAKAIKTIGHSYRRESILNFYLDQHRISNKSNLPPDYSLLLKIRDTIKSHQSIDEARKIKINSWFKERGLEKYLN